MPDKSNIGTKLSESPPRTERLYATKDYPLIAFQKKTDDGLQHFPRSLTVGILVNSAPWMYMDLD
jgi:hypothetical protein